MLFLRSLFFTILLPGTVTVLIPYWLVSSRSRKSLLSEHPLGYLGLPLMAAGALALLWCIWDFFNSGRGTLAPIDPPKHLVVRGLYRYVRNPMYVAVLTILLGEAIFFVSRPLVMWAGAFFLLANIFVVFYEESVLKHQFGEAYKEYTRKVGRWIPRIR